MGPLKRSIQRLIQNPLAMQLLDSKIRQGDHIKIKGDSGTQKMKLRISREAKSEEPAELQAAGPGKSTSKQRGR